MDLVVAAAVAEGAGSVAPAEMGMEGSFLDFSPRQML